MPGPPLPISALESYLSYWLHYVGYRLSHELGRKTQKLGVTAAEWVFLRKLHENESMPSHLAARLGLTRSAISKLAKRLEAKALIHRTKSLLDGRAKLLKLTQLGCELMPRLAASADQTEARNFGRASRGYRRSVERVMKWIVRRDRLRFVPPGECSLIPELGYESAAWERGGWG
jgi:DNA-binding MarR family transcriptional regulator